MKITLTKKQLIEAIVNRETLVIPIPQTDEFLPLVDPDKIVAFVEIEISPNQLSP